MNHSLNTFGQSVSQTLASSLMSNVSNEKGLYASGDRVSLPGFKSTTISASLIEGGASQFQMPCYRLAGVLELIVLRSVYKLPLASHWHQALFHFVHGPAPLGVPPQSMGHSIVLHLWWTSRVFIQKGVNALRWWVDFRCVDVLKEVFKDIHNGLCGVTGCALCVRHCHYV